MPLRVLRWFACALALASPLVWADGKLTHLSGIVSVLKADGKTLPGGPGLLVQQGDTVITGAGGYVRMEMTDGGEIVVRPDSRLKIESYAFVQAKPAEDNLVFSMLKGGIRTVTGLIGKRGNKDAYEMKTPTATVGIRGTQFDARICQGDCGALADGTYLTVRFGALQAANAHGTVPIAAGQFAHVPRQSPPALLPRDPGIGFTPPVVIPKLDERKKQQAQQTQDASGRAGGTPADRPGEKPGPAADARNPQQEKQEAKPDAATQPAQTQDTPARGGAPLSSLLDRPATPSGGQECSVE